MTSDGDTFIQCDNIADANAVDMGRYKLVNELSGPNRWVFMRRARKPVPATDRTIADSCRGLLAVMRDLIGTNPMDRHKPIHIDELAGIMTITKPEIEDALSHLLRAGEIYSPRQDWYSLI